MDKAKEELEKRLKIRQNIDAVIESVSANIKNGDVPPELYAGTIMALASLVEARATLT